MKSSKFFTLKQNLLFILTMLIVLVVVITMLYVDLQKENIKSRINSRLVRLVGLAKTEEEEGFNNTEKFLVTISHYYSLTHGNAKKCCPIFHQIKDHYPEYKNIMILNNRGDVVCSINKHEQSIDPNIVSVMEKEFYNKKFVSAEVADELNPGENHILIWYSDKLANNSGNLFVIELDNKWFDEILNHFEIEIPENSKIIIADDNGKVLAELLKKNNRIRYLNPCNSNYKFLFNENSAVFTIFDGLSGQTLVATTGIKSLLGLKKIHLILEVPEKVAFADVNEVWHQNMFLLMGFIAVLILTVGFGGNSLILKRVDRLVETSEEIARGNYKTRTHLPYSHGEIGKIAEAFDSMAEELEQREIVKKKINEELVLAKEKAEESDKLKTEFLAQMSHEIRTPLNIIVGYINILQEELSVKMSQDYAPVFHAIDNATKRLLRTMNLILDMSFAQIGRVEIKLETIDLSLVIISVLSEYKTAADNKKVDLKFTRETTNVFQNTDETLITKILQNFVDNAVKFTNQGAVEVILGENSFSQIFVEVKDSGVGISKDFIQKLFNPFLQEESGNTRAYDGNGLGLSLAKKYADLLNAEIEVKSNKGSGSIFRLIFK